VISGIVVNESRLSGMLKSKVDMGGGLTMLELRVTGRGFNHAWAKSYLN
jgi:hypothetical protein